MIATTFSDSDNTSCSFSPEILDPHPPEIEALRRLSDNIGSIFQSPDFEFCSDALITVGSIEFRVHRCVLSARSPFFRDFFARKGETRVEIGDLKGEFEVGVDALGFVIEYVYCGRVGDLPKGVCMCADEECVHVGCRPLVGFMVEVLYASFVFQIWELVSLFKRHLLDILDKVAIDDVPIILSVANFCGSVCEKLLIKCIEIIVISDLDVITLEKTLPPEIFKQVEEARSTHDLQGLESSGYPDKHVKRIHRALDSDDVELVRMLLKEGPISLDDAYALHYAVAHCDSKISLELLDLELADVNHKNQRGYTVLHMAAMRKEPKLIVSLLTKGARPTDLTLDGRKAVQISRRLTKFVDYYRIIEEGKPSPKERLCIEILEQAERRDPLVGEASVSLAMAGDDLRGRLLYLENRVALASCLFPMEARVAMDIAQVDGTLEFSLGTSANHRSTVDLNETPFKIKEEHLIRVKALSRTVELGKRFFPRCSEVLNKIMDDDVSELACFGHNVSEDRRKRYMELQDILTKAFTEDKEEFDKSGLSSSSSTSAVVQASNLF
uniref:Non-expressor of pathogenesis-related protein 1 isoform X2 n=1 Tax=Oncidium hybrid cultivar TaxID=141207 RepID=A0A6M3WGY4_ONCHC|nr:non-expressor of pathogenesis-related protein 1 isoform X2 [Oncidium hybrid cultivar]